MSDPETLTPERANLMPCGHGDDLDDGSIAWDRKPCEHADCCAIRADFAATLDAARARAERAEARIRELEAEHAVECIAQRNRIHELEAALRDIMNNAYLRTNYQLFTMAERALSGPREASDDL